MLVNEEGVVIMLPEYDFESVLVIVMLFHGPGDYNHYYHRGYYCCLNSLSIV